MRRYGDRETAKEMLTLRDRTELDEVGSVSDTISNLFLQITRWTNIFNEYILFFQAFAEGLNIGMRGQVLAMK